MRRNNRTNATAIKLQKAINMQVLRDINSIISNEITNQKLANSTVSKEQLNQLLIAIVNKKAIKLVRNHANKELTKANRYKIFFKWYKNGCCIINATVNGETRIAKLSKNEINVFLEGIYDLYLWFNNIQNEEENIDFYFEYLN